MAYRSKRGSALLEAVLVLPLIFLALTGLLLACLISYRSYVAWDAGTGALRRGAYGWYREKGLYEDILGDHEESPSARSKLEQAEADFRQSLASGQSGSVASQFRIRNLLLYKSLQLECRTLGGQAFSYQASYPFSMGSVFLRSARYGRELLEDAFAFLEGRGEEEGSGEEGGRQVYVVDEGMDRREYDRVYHLYRDCPYVSRGSPRTGTQQGYRSQGFRPCMICLARKSGME